jgi:spore maturation protein CgeB
MRILMLWALYDEYIDSFYQRHPGLSGAAYAEQQRALLNDFFGWPGYLVRAFRVLGHEADILYGNVKPLQSEWAKEHNVPFREEHWRAEIPQRQIQSYRPDILFLGAISEYWGTFLEQVRNSCGRVFLWIASALQARPPQWVDCILTSFPHYAKQFREEGIASRYFQVACFDPEIRKVLPDLERDIDVGFVGSFIMGTHSRRMEMLSYLANHGLEVKIWGSIIDGGLPKHPVRFYRYLQSQRRIRPLKKYFHHEPVFGMEMYALLSRFHLSPNIHEDVAGNVASNMRLFETTGCGALLVTDNLPYLGNFFEIGREVVVYDNLDDLVNKVQFYLAHKDAAEEIASYGRERTLHDHTSNARAKELISLFEQASIS